MSKPVITPSENGPLVVEGLEHFTNSKGDIQTKPKMSLCRCGGSSNKPFCDGTHNKNGFSSARGEPRAADKRKDYPGEGIVVHDNRHVCSHAAHCTNNLPEVFRQNEKPWIDARAAERDEVIATIRQCPSGALSYTMDHVEHRDRAHEPAIHVAHDGPLEVRGGPELKTDHWGEGASKEHYTLCRCGASRNKPFCDGSHWDVEFTDEKN